MLDAVWAVGQRSEAKPGRPSDGDGAGRLKFATPLPPDQQAIGQP